MSTKKKSNKAGAAGNTSVNGASEARHASVIDAERNAPAKAGKFKIGDDVTFTPDADKHSEILKEFPDKKSVDATIIDINADATGKNFYDLKIFRPDTYPVYARQIDPKQIA